MEAGTRAEVRAVGGTALVFGTLFLDRLAPLYLIVVLREELTLRPVELAGLPLAIGLGWAAAMALGRWLSGRMPDRTRIALGAGGAALAHLLSAFTGVWPLFLAMRFIGGVFAGSVSPPVTGMVFAFAPPRRRGLDAGITFSSTRLLGSLVSPIVVLAVAVRAGWQPAIATAAVLLGLATVAFWIIAPAAPRDTRSTAERRTHSRVVLAPQGRRNIALATVFGILTATWLTVISQLGPSAVVASLDVTPDRAGAIVGGFGIGGWVAAALVPLLSDRVGRGAAAGGALAIGGAAGVALYLALAGGAAGWLATALFAAGGIAMGALPLALSVIPGEAVLGGDPGRAIILPVCGAEVVGAALLPALALLEVLPDRTMLGIVGAALLVAAALAAALVSPQRHLSAPPTPG